MNVKDKQKTKQIKSNNSKILIGFIDATENGVFSSNMLETFAGTDFRSTLLVQELRIKFNERNTPKIYNAVVITINSVHFLAS